MNLPLNIFLLIRKRIDEIKSSNNVLSQTQTQPKVEQKVEQKVEPKLEQKVDEKANNSDTYNNNMNNKLFDKFTKQEKPKQSRLENLINKGKEQEVNTNNNYNNTINYSNNTNNKMDIDYDDKSNKNNDPLKEKVFSQLERIMSEINNFDNSADFFKDLEMVISNITDHPNEEKYKKLKIEANLFQRSFMKYKQAINFLEFADFAKMDIDGKDYYVFTGSNDSLTRIDGYLHRFLIEKRNII